MSGRARSYWVNFAHKWGNMEPNSEPFKLTGEYGWLTELAGADEGEFVERVQNILSTMTDATACLSENKWKAQELRIITYLLCASARLNQRLAERMAELTPG